MFVGCALFLYKNCNKKGDAIDFLAKKYEISTTKFQKNRECLGSIPEKT
jgi:hypothetical protein